MTPSVATEEFPASESAHMHPKATTGPKADSERRESKQKNPNGFTFLKPPTYSSVEEERQGLKERLAAAFRVFGKLGFDETVAGHLTVRDPERKDCFWVNPFGIPFSLMTVSDLLLVDHHGEIVGGGKPDRQFYNKAAFVIHSAIHAARPDVDAACHSHSVYGKAFSTLGKKLDITTQDSCVFFNHHNLYPSFGGVVLEAEESARICEYLGDNKALIMQNHGILSVGKTIESAVAWFIVMEKCCQVQLLADAAAAGTNSQTIKISDAEAQFTFDAVGTEAAGYFMSSPYFMMVDAESNGSYKQ